MSAVPSMSARCHVRMRTAATFGGRPDRRRASPDCVAWDFRSRCRLPLPGLFVRTRGLPAVGERVLIAWKGTREAVRAVRDALPILRAAQRVVLIEVADDAPPNDAQRIALLEVQAWLNRHDVESEVRLESGADAAGDVLLSRASDFESDLIVMGAYGHSRVREWVLGGVTRHLLNHMTVPTLMSH